MLRPRIRHLYGNRYTEIPTDATRVQESDGSVITLFCYQSHVPRSVSVYLTTTIDKSSLNSTTRQTAGS